MKSALMIGIGALALWAFLALLSRAAGTSSAKAA